MTDLVFDSVCVDRDLMSEVAGYIKKWVSAHEINFSLIS